MAEPVLDARRHSLTLVEFDVLWEWSGQGPTPIVLQVGSPGRTHTERRSLQETAWHGLRARGLARRSDPDAELVRLLHLLARPAEQLELRAWWGHEVRALAAGRSGEGALAVRSESTITMSACGSLPAALAGVFPTAERGPGQACTVPTAALADAPVAELRATLRDRGVAAADAGLLAQMFAGTNRRAQVVALGTDRWQVLRRVGGVLGVLDGPCGRYLLTRRTGDDGVEWATLAPADPRRLRHAITALLDTAVEGAAG